jgi:beta-glucanase (GH16 family)
VAGVLDARGQHRYSRVADVRRDRCDGGVGQCPTSVRGSLHGPLPASGSYDLGKSFQPGPDLSADYHEYAIEWAPNSVKFFIDDIEYTNYGAGDVYGGGRWVFNDQPFHIVMNLALIGNVTAVFPQSLLIDWIRVYSAVRPQPTTRQTTATRRRSPTAEPGSTIQKRRL